MGTDIINIQKYVLQHKKIEWEVITPITEYYSELAAIDTLDKLKTSGDLTQEQYDKLKDFYENDAYNDEQKVIQLISAQLNLDIAAVLAISDKDKRASVLKAMYAELKAASDANEPGAGDRLRLFLHIPFYDERPGALIGGQSGVDEVMRKEFYESISDMFIWNVQNERKPETPLVLDDLRFPLYG